MVWYSSAPNTLLFSPNQQCHSGTTVKYYSSIAARPPCFTFTCFDASLAAALPRSFENVRLKVAFSQFPQCFTARFSFQCARCSFLALPCA